MCLLSTGIAISHILGWRPGGGGYYH